MQVPPRLNRDRLTLIAALVAPLLLTAILAPFRTSFANTDAALALIVVVVAVAANGYRLAGILAALSSAVWFDFFLTQPYARFSISGRTDVETTILLIVIGVAVTEIAVWGRRQHEMASRRAGYLDGIRSAAAAVAAGKSSSDVAEQVCDWLVQVLSLRVGAGSNTASRGWAPRFACTTMGASRAATACGTRRRKASPRAAKSKCSWKAAGCCVGAF
ncbi:MAG: DUF4118 domain-containing protein [Gemmatimonadota bacterium]